MADQAKEIKAHCPTCKGPRRADIVAEHTEFQEDDEHNWFQTDHRILKCRGCEAVFHQTESTESGDFEWEGDDVTFASRFEYWPSPLKRPRPAFVSEYRLEDQDLRYLLQSSYTAMDHDLDVLAAIGLRTAFDRAMELLGIDPALQFWEKLKHLLDGGFIGVTEKEILEALTEAGGAAAHRGWKPSAQELDTMFSIIEGFLDRNFVVRSAAKQLANRVPPKPKRQPKKNAPSTTEKL